MPDSNPDTTPGGESPKGETPASITGAETEPTVGGETTKVEIDKSELERLQRGNADMAGKLRLLEKERQDADAARAAKEKENAEKAGDYKKQLEIANSEREALQSKYDTTNGRLRDLTLRKSLEEIGAKHTTCVPALVDLIINDFDIDFSEGANGNPVLKGDSPLDPETYIKGVCEKKFPGTTPSKREGGAGLVKTEQESSESKLVAVPENFDSLPREERKAFLRENPALRNKALSGR